MTPTEMREHYKLKHTEFPERTSMSEYIDPDTATHIRIFQAGDKEWQIDAADGEGGYTEACWDSRYREVDGERVWEYIPSLATALALADDFARENVPHLEGTMPYIKDDVPPTEESIREEFLQLLQGNA